jgi:phosphatidylglycerophosphate synthase
MAKKVEKHERVNDILLGPLERPALQWLAAHMPDWVNPDMLTILGIIASVLTLVSYALMGGHEVRGNGFLWLASFGFFMNWFGDSLDGSLARYRHIERPRFGYFIDHSVDAFSVTAIFIGLGLSGMVPFSLGVLAAVGYLMAMINVYLKTFVTGIFEMTTAKIGPTEIRLLAVLINILVFFFGNPEVTLPLFGKMNVFTLALGVVTVLLFGYFFYRTTSDGLRLAMLDGKRLERRQEREAKKAAKELEKEIKKKKKDKKDKKK